MRRFRGEGGGKEREREKAFEPRKDGRKRRGKKDCAECPVFDGCGGRRDGNYGGSPLRFGLFFCRFFSTACAAHRRPVRREEETSRVLLQESLPRRVPRRLPGYPPLQAHRLSGGMLSAMRLVFRSPTRNSLRSSLSPPTSPIFFSPPWLENFTVPPSASALVYFLLLV